MYAGTPVLVGNKQDNQLAERQFRILDPDQGSTVGFDSQIRRNESRPGIVIGEVSRVFLIHDVCEMFRTGAPGGGDTREAPVGITLYQSRHTFSEFPGRKRHSHTCSPGTRLTHRAGER
jgi:hypothetical protein